VTTDVFSQKEYFSYIQKIKLEFTSSYKK